jgi:hypothetical protein
MSLSVNGAEAIALNINHVAEFFQPFLLNNFGRAEVHYVIDNIRACGVHPRETLAGRADRVLVDRTADTLQRQCEAP